VFAPGTAPPPLAGAPYTACLFCDDALKDFLALNSAFALYQAACMREAAVCVHNEFCRCVFAHLSQTVAPAASLSPHRARAVLLPGPPHAPLRLSCPLYHHRGRERPSHNTRKHLSTRPCLPRPHREQLQRARLPAVLAHRLPAHLAPHKRVVEHPRLYQETTTCALRVRLCVCVCVCVCV
jgi:hypothetical protein